MKCPRCGGNNFGWAKRCDHCGHDFASPRLRADTADRAVRINTPAGAEIALTPATSAQIGLLRRCWRFGVEDWPGINGGSRLICRRPDREMMAVKFQQVDMPAASAPLVRFQNRVLIALALGEYLKRNHGGFLMPCAYVKPKGLDRAETGIAYLVGPDPDFKSVSREPFDERWDAAIGPGASAMVSDFAQQVGRVGGAAPQGRSLQGGAAVGRPVFLTMELRPVSSLGNLAPTVAVLGPSVVVTMADPGSNFDSSWDFVARAGFSALGHAPIEAVELRADGSLHAM
jgi:hypothetical protein